MFSQVSRSLLPKFRFNSAAAAAAAATVTAFSASFCTMSSGTESKAAQEGVLSPQEFRAFRLKERIDLNHNTSVFRFELPAGAQQQLPIASCLVTRAKLGDEHKDVIRPYTPTSSNQAHGHFDLTVKRYDQGNMSRHIHSLQVGDTLEMKGPIPKIQYQANMKRHIGMVAGGTGITPMYQVLQQICDDPTDQTQVTLLYANVEFQDILLLPQLLHLSYRNPNLRIYFILDRPPPEWPFAQGRISAELLQQVMPAPSPDSMVWVCGPPPMMNAISGDKAPDKTQGPLTGFLRDLGYTPDMVFKF